MRIELNLHDKYCEIDNDDCPMLHKNEDVLISSYCAYFTELVGGEWEKSDGYHILRVEKCLQADGLSKKP
jgi:hypothetical protein